MTDRCKYDAETKIYVLPDGEACDVPRREHCTAKRGCAQHLGWGELTCARCVGRCRQDLRVIVDRSAELMTEAMVAGVQSEALNLAGPAADYRVFSARRAIDKAWIQRWIPERRQLAAMENLLEDDDELHPYSVLTRWAMMLGEDYDVPLPDQWTVSGAADVIERQLHRVAQDEDQDFALLSRELKKCRNHIETVLRDSQEPERGVPCPTCAIDRKFARLVREYGHWCHEDDCARLHYLDDSGDRWVCPRDSTHVWTLGEYSNWLEERMGA